MLRSQRREEGVPAAWIMHPQAAAPAGPLHMISVSISAPSLSHPTHFSRLCLFHKVLIDLPGPP